MPQGKAIPSIAGSLLAFAKPDQAGGDRLGPEFLWKGWPCPDEKKNKQIGKMRC
jgi:hypothetical protein